MGTTGSTAAHRLGKLDNWIIAKCLQHIHLEHVRRARLTCRRVQNIELCSFLIEIFRVFDQAELHRLLVAKFCKAFLWPADVLPILLQSGVPVDYRDGDGKPPLCIAAGHGRTDTVHELLAAGATVDLTESDYGSTPLIVAAADESPHVPPFWHTFSFSHG